MSANGLEIRDRVLGSRTRPRLQSLEGLAASANDDRCDITSRTARTEFRLDREVGKLVVLFGLLEDVVDDGIEVVEDGLYAVVLVAVVSPG